MLSSQQTFLSLLPPFFLGMRVEQTKGKKERRDKTKRRKKKKKKKTNNNNNNNRNNECARPRSV